MAATVDFGEMFIPPDEFEKNVQKLIQSVDFLSKKFEALGRVIEVKATRRVKELREEIAKLPITNKDVAQSLAQFERQINELTDANKKLQTELEKYQKKAKETKKSTEELAQDTDKLEKNTKKSTKANKKQKESLLELAVRYLRTTVVVTQLYRGLLTLQNGMNAAFNSFVEFEKEMQQVRAVTGASEREFQRLTQTAKDLGATTEFTASQIANLQKELAKLGFRPQEIIESTAAIADLATATGEDLVSSARVAASTLRAFNLEASEMDRVTNLMAGSFVRSGLNLEKFSESMKFIAPNAAAINVSIETTTALLSKLADAGLRGTQAGTALRNIFSDLAAPNSKLAQRLGFTVNSSEELVLAFQKLSEEGVNFGDVAQMVDKTALQQFQIILKNIGSVEDLERVYKELEFEGRKLADMMRDTLANDIEILSSTMDALGRNVLTSIDRFGQAEGDVGNFRKSTQSLTSTLQQLSNQFELQDNLISSLASSTTLLAAKTVDSFFGIAASIAGVNMEIGPMEKFLTWWDSSFDNVAVSTNKATDALEQVLIPMSQISQKMAEGLRSEKFTKDSEEYLKLQTEFNELQLSAASAFKSVARDLEFVETYLERYAVAEEEAKNAGIELDETEKEKIKQLKISKGIYEAQIDTLERYGLTLQKAEKIIEDTEGEPVVNYALKISKLKAETDAYIATLERQSQLQDTTLVAQAKTAQDIADKRIKTIQEELKLRKEELDVQANVLGDNLQKAKDVEIAKANAAITRERIKLENQLRQIRQKQADLTNRELIPQLNTEIKVSERIKNNTLESFDSRIHAAEKYYESLGRLVDAEELREKEILRQKRADLGLADEVFRAEMTEIEEKYIQTRLDNNARYQIDLFNLEQQSYLQRIRIQQDFRDTQLSIDGEDAKQQQSAMNLRLSQMAIERRGLTFMFNERKKLLEEERDLRINQIKVTQELEKRAAQNAFDDEMVTYRQQLAAKQLEKEDFDKLKIEKEKELTAKLKTIEVERGNEIEQVNLETTQNIKDSWHDTFVEIVEVVQQAMGSLFSFLSEKRKAELERLKEWEDARLEYVKGNAEAEALVRFEAEQRRKEIARKEAKDARAQALFEIALNTAVGISKAVTDGAFFMIPIIAALGASQAAVVLATPLPEFYKGTDNAPEGLAKVDERGQELIYRKKRNVLELGSKNGERVTYLDRGDQVFTALQTKKLLKDGSDSIISNNLIADSVNRATSSERMVLKATDEDKIIRGLTSAIKSIPQSETIFDERGVSRRMRKRNNVVQTLNKRYKLG